MAKTLGSVTLPDSIEWVDRYTETGVLQAVDITLGGTPVVHSLARALGLPVTLEARERVTWLDSATVQALAGLAAVPGATYTLDWEGEAHTVAFDHEQGALRFEEVLPHTGQWTGTIRLITV